MSFDLPENDSTILDEDLKFILLQFVCFNNGLGNGYCVNSRWLFNKFSPDQRSYLRNIYKRCINSFYVENHVGSVLI